MAKQIKAGKMKGSPSVESEVDVLSPIMLYVKGMGAGVARLLCLRHQGTKRHVQL